MNRRFSPGHEELAAYERARWVDGSYQRDRFEQERCFVHKTGDELDRWARQRQGQVTDYSGRGPRSGGRSDARILEDVCQELERNSEVDASEIEVDCRDGEVTLQGWVHDRNQKRVAEWIADGIRGVKDVHNRLRVQEPSRTGQPAVRGESAREREISTDSTVTGATRDTNNGGMPGVY
jgi:hypothetical protein